MTDPLKIAERIGKLLPGFASFVYPVTQTPAQDTEAIPELVFFRVRGECTLTRVVGYGPITLNGARILLRVQRVSGSSLLCTIANSTLVFLGTEVLNTPVQLYKDDLLTVQIVKDSPQALTPLSLLVEFGAE